ncbi:MAG: hypothetical protein CMP10_06520 [Zetaproteobacteria bacterium]|nr:hypothetical protein [Pseudobdellovibrionaceae bacterium]
MKSILLFILVLSCSTSDKNNGKQINIISHTIFPNDINHKTFSRNEVSNLVLPSRLIDAGVIKRPNAELRTGPGPQYEIFNELLFKDDVVVTFEKVGQWRKVVLTEPFSDIAFSNKPPHTRKGWVHSKSYMNLTPQRYIKIKKSSLPVVFSLKKISRAWSFHNGKEEKVEIPDQTMFRVIRQTKDKVLIVIEETQSIAWLSLNDVK